MRREATHIESSWVNVARVGQRSINQARPSTPLLFLTEANHPRGRDTRGGLQNHTVNLWWNV